MTILLVRSPRCCVGVVREKEMGSITNPYVTPSDWVPFESTTRVISTGSKARFSRRRGSGCDARGVVRGWECRHRRGASDASRGASRRMHPSFAATDRIAAHSESCSRSCSSTSRTARSRTSGAYRLGRPIASIFPTNEVSGKPGTVQGVLRQNSILPRVLIFARCGAGTRAMLLRGLA